MPTNDPAYDLHLDVPYYRQNDPGEGLTEFWQQRSCGVLALRMVIDYWRLKAGLEPVSLVGLFDQAMANDGVDANGNWMHSALVKTARDYDLLSWRRMWSLSSDQRRGAAASGVDGDSLVRNEIQQRREALPTLVEALVQGKPVIISVAKNFDSIDKPHLVVLTGVRRRTKLGAFEGIFYNDPYAPTHSDAKDRYVTISKFNEKWNYLAIFVEPLDKQP
jgi:hypothetical protein